MSKKQQDEISVDADVPTPRRVADTSVNKSQTLIEKSFLLVVKVPEPQVDEDMLKDRISSPQDRMERWRKTSKPAKRDIPKIQLPDNKELLSGIALKLEAETGEIPVLLKTASTFVVNLTEAELEEVKTWADIQEIIPNDKIER